MQVDQGKKVQGLLQTFTFGVLFFALLSLYTGEDALVRNIFAAVIATSLWGLFTLILYQRLSERRQRQWFWVHSSLYYIVVIVIGCLGILYVYVI